MGRVVGERRHGHVGPAFGDRQPGRGGHRVELVGRRPADHPRSQPHAALLGERDELALGALRTGLVTRHRQHHVIDAHRPHLDGRAAVARVGGGVGHERLDDEPSAGSEPVGDGRETLLLPPVVDEVEQRVVRGQCHVERALRKVIDHVAADHRDITVRVGRGESVQHRRAGVDAGHRQPGSRHRDAQPTGTDTELEHSAARRGEPRDHRHRGIDVGDGGVPIVVHVGERLAVRVGAVALHRSQAMARMSSMGPAIASGW